MDIDFLATIESETEALVSAARRGPSDSPVAGCPGWNLARLCSHVGRVQRYSTAIVSTSSQALMSDIPKPQPGTEADYVAAGTGPLLTAMRSRDLEEPCWNFTGSRQVVGFWLRRQAHEVSIHRWDAQSAVGDPDPIDTELALDGINELFDVILPIRLGGRDDIEVGGTIHLHATDSVGEWILHTDDGVFRVEHGHAKSSVAVRGPADRLLLALWHRIDIDDETIEVFGDASVFERWLALGVM